jgi:predicted transcriptional regulator
VGPKAVVRNLRITASNSKSYYTLALAQAAKQSRVQHALYQTELAKRMKSSQSRIAKIEAAAPSVSIDLMVRALLVSGAALVLLNVISRNPLAVKQVLR